MYDLVKTGIDKRSFSFEGKNIIAAVSGGRDSMAMLQFFSRQKDSFGISKLTAAHFNHGLRGEESDADEALVKNYAQSLKIPVISENGNMSSRKKPKGFSTESWARQLRYDFLLRAADEDDAYIITGHTKDDRAETVLFFLARGTGLRGASGIPFQNGRIIRPLIDVSREDVNLYISGNKVPYRDDSTNLSDIYSRNIIRNKVLPLLNGINESAAENIVRFSEIAKQADDYFIFEAIKLVDKARRAGGYDAAKLLAVPDILTIYALRDIASGAGILPDEKLTGEMRAVLRGEKNGVQLSPGYCFTNINGIAAISAEGKRAESFYYEKPALRGMNTFPGGQKIFIEELLPSEIKSKGYHPETFQNAVDCGKISGSLVLRNRREGDVFRHFARGNAKSLKKLFNERKIPAEKRYFVPILSDDEGILWLAGEGASTRGAADESAGKILIISTEKR